MFGDNERVKAYKKLIAKLKADGKDTLAAQAELDLASLQDELTKGFLESAVGDIPQATPQASGRAQFQPQNFKSFAMSPFISDNPMSMGGETFVPVDREALNPEEKKRSPWWGLMGYNA